MLGGLPYLVDEGIHYVHYSALPSLGLIRTYPTILLPS